MPAKPEEYCVKCDRVTPSTADRSAGAIVYRCEVCGHMVDWDIADDDDLEFALRQRKKRDSGH